MFFNKPGLKMVETGRFLVAHSGSGRIINPELWAASVAPGDQIFMSMLVERLGHRTGRPVLGAECLFLR
jgi:hypothetical protein